VMPWRPNDTKRITIPSYKYAVSEYRRVGVSR
jgi:hypothetical protein